MSLLDDVSIVVTPNGYKAGELYAVVPVPTEGAELVTNGEFAADANWTKATGWTISGGAANCDGTQTGNSGLVQQNGILGVTLDLQVGKQYKMIIDVIVSAGAIANVEVGSNYSFDAISTTSTSTLYFSPTSTNDRITITANSSFVGSVNSVSVKEYTSADMDVTRATAATRVDEDGLVNYAQVISDTELITNGDFATDSDWSKGGGWSIGGGVATHSGNTSANISQNNFLTVGTDYSVTYTVVNASVGSQIGISTNSSSIQIVRTTDGTYTETFTATLTSFYIRSLWNNGNPVSVDNVSVKKVDLDNVPRIDYTGGGCPHILAEPQRTNLVTYSEDLSQWTLTNGTLTPNATVSPDGTQNAGKVVFNNTGVDLKRTITVVAGQTYTISFYIKLESGTGLDGRFYDNSNGANIDVYDYTSQIQGTEWSRITRSVTAPSGCTEMQIWLLASSSSLVTASFWGAQFELGSYPTSLIPTSGSTVTRNQDIFTRDGIGSLINDSEGVLFAEIAALDNDGTFRMIAISDGTIDNVVNFYYRTDINKITIRLKSGSTQEIFENFDITATNFNKVAFRYKSGESNLFINGVKQKVSDYTATNMPIGLSQLSLDSGGNTNFFFGKVKQLQVYTTALTDEQLTSLTT